MHDKQEKQTSGTQLPDLGHDVPLSPQHTMADLPSYPQTRECSGSCLTKIIFLLGGLTRFPADSHPVSTHITLFTISGWESLDVWQAR